MLLGQQLTQLWPENNDVHFKALVKLENKLQKVHSVER